MHFEIVSAGAIQPNTGAAGVVFTGDSLTIRNAKDDVDILAMWQTNQTAGFGQVTFPTGHDTTRGYRAGAAVGVNPAMLPIGAKIPVTPQELLSITIAGSNTAGDLEQLSMLIRYKNFPGINMRAIGASELERRTEKMTTVEASLTSAAGPGYSGSEAINADSDLLLANRDYAVLGMSSRTSTHALCLSAPDFGNIRVAVPGVLRQEITSQWFALLSRAHGESLIPVFNSGNKAQTLLTVAADENAGTFLVTVYLALLSKGGQ